MTEPEDPPFIKFLKSTKWYEGGPLLAEGHLAKDAWNAAIDQCISALLLGDITLLPRQRMRALQYHESSHPCIYDETYGADKLCECGHPYYRHFDTYDNMRHCGCKYCGCWSFVLAAEQSGNDK